MRSSRWPKRFVRECSTTRDGAGTPPRRPIDSRHADEASLMLESSPGSSVELDIFAYQACNTARTSRDDGVGFETPVAQWSYALLFDLPTFSSVPFVVELALDSHEGRIGAGCVDESMARYVSGEVFFDAADGAITKTILVDSSVARFLV